MKYEIKNELVRRNQRVVYHLPTADALGLANYSEAREIKAAESRRKQNLAFKRFIREAIATKSKHFAPGRTNGVG